jgi:surface-anchored protein
MMRTPSRLLFTLAALWAWSFQARGHSHLEIVRRASGLAIVYYDFDSGEADPASVLLSVGPPAARPVPSLPSFTSVLGEAGSTTWILPEASNADLLWLGIGNGSLRPADFTGALQLSLQSVEGPGHFALFQNDAFGGLLAHMNSRDGIGPTDSMPVPLGSHIHCNWAFSAPGLHRVRFVVTGTLRAGNTPVASPPAEFVFDVEPPPSPVLALGRTSTNRLGLSVTAQPGLNYRIETSERLDDWVLLTHLTASGAVTTLPLDGPSHPYRFFRARLR